MESNQDFPRMRRASCAFGPCRRIGSPGSIRTNDPRVNSSMLLPLSYRGIIWSGLCSWALHHAIYLLLKPPLSLNRIVYYKSCSTNNKICMTTSSVLWAVCSDQWSMMALLAGFEPTTYRVETGRSSVEPQEHIYCSVNNSYLLNMTCEWMQISMSLPSQRSPWQRTAKVGFEATEASASIQKSYSIFKQHLKYTMTCWTCQGLFSLA